MSTSTLSAHSPKFESKLVVASELQALPEPVALGLRHKPVPHARLVDAISEEIDRRGWRIVRSQFALGAKGAALFGVLDMQPMSETSAALVKANGRGLSFGFRSSTNESLAIKAVAGSRVFVCDNLALSGDMIAIQRKSTTGLDLKDAITIGFDKFLTHAAALDVSIERMAQRGISDMVAKALIFDVFYQGILPARLFDDVGRYYFKAETADVEPRTLWGLHNAFTRAARDLTPVRLFGASVGIGRAFDTIIEGEVVGHGDAN